MNLVFRLLDPKVARAFYEWMTGLWVFAAIFVGDVNLDRFQRWLLGTPQEHQATPSSIEDPPLSALLLDHLVRAQRRGTVSLSDLPVLRSTTRRETV
jgi:hypothetical protein